MFKRDVFVVILFLVLVTPIYSQHGQKKKEQPLTRILFVFDASQSMYGRLQDAEKIVIARRLLTNLVDSLKDVENLQLALRMYGHQYSYPPPKCDDTKLEVPFSDDNHEKIKHKLKVIIPRGTTPIARSLLEAGNDFPECDNCRNIIILITDGKEECDGDPCAVSQALQKKGIVLKPFVIGVGRDFRDAFECVGTYYDAASEKSFRTALDIVISQALNSTTAQVNLLDIDGNPSETNIAMTFYDSFSGLVKYNFIHTMNNRGVPDTLYIDPLPIYNVTVHSVPSVHLDSVSLIPGKHKVIPLDVPQGFLSLEVNGTVSKVKGLKSIVRKKGSMETVNVQEFRSTSKYIVGLYDLEVLCLPRMHIHDVEVSQSKTTKVQIPAPGILVIKKSVQGYGSICVHEDNELKWVCNLNDNIINESVVLQPGNYSIIFRSRHTTNTNYTIEKSFAIKSGSSLIVDLFKD